MKMLFLFITFFSLMLTVHAQRQFLQYTCQAAHKHSETAFYLKLNNSKEVEVGGWKVRAGLKRKDNMVEISLSRVINVMDATYRKEEKKLYPLNGRVLPVELEHSFGGRSDIFNLTCYPRDP
jgi:hypothetical protein